MLDFPGSGLAAIAREIAQVLGRQHLPVPSGVAGSWSPPPPPKQ